MMFIGNAGGTGNEEEAAPTFRLIFLFLSKRISQFFWKRGQSIHVISHGEIKGEQGVIIKRTMIKVSYTFLPKWSHANDFTTVL